MTVTCPECKGTDIGEVTKPELYDGVLYWLCTCGRAFHRFSTGSQFMQPVYEIAHAEIIKVNNERLTA